MPPSPSSIVAFDDDDDCLVVDAFTGHEALDRQRRERHAHECAQRELTRTRSQLERVRSQCDAMASERAHSDATVADADARLVHTLDELKETRANHATTLAANRRLVAQCATNDARVNELTEQNAQAVREVAQAQLAAEQGERMACAVCYTLYVELQMTSEFSLF